MKNAFLIFCLMLLPILVRAQDKPMTEEEKKALRDSLASMPEPSYLPLIVKINDSGSKYIRFITWHQVWLQNQNLKENDFSFLLRRSRLLAYAQVTDRFLILTHFGINNLSAQNMDPIGDGRSSDSPQLFVHAAWAEFKLSKGDQLYMGTGLHYWNGLSRITSASTLNFMTLDNYRQGWAQLGLSDQFARHLGVYWKGMLGKLRYTLAVNNAIRNGLGSADEPDLADGSITYSGVRTTDKGDWVVTGYVDYEFFDKESNKLPYRVGSYLGAKKVFNVGVGFFANPNGTVFKPESGAADTTLQNENVFHFAADLFYDRPLGDGAINFYGVYYNYNYGENYSLGAAPVYGTGNSIYAHFGYMLPFKIGKEMRLMPYISASYRNFEVFENNGNDVHLGLNWFVRGHNAKFTLEYRNTLFNYNGDNAPDRINGLVLQTHIFL